MTAPTRWGGRRAQQLAQLVVQVYGTRCYWCHQPIDLALPRTHPRGLSVEHLVPTSLGGPMWDIRNCRPAHLTENTSRGNRAAPARPARVSAVFPVS